MQIIFKNSAKKLKLLEYFKLQRLEIVDKTKILGVDLNKDCTLKFHIKNIVKESILILLLRVVI